MIYTTVWFIVGVVLVVAHRRVDASALRLTRAAVRKAGEWLDFDQFDCARRTNDVGRPLAVCATLFGAARYWPVLPDCFLAGVVGLLIYGWRSFRFEPTVISEVAVARHIESARGAASLEVWQNLRVQRYIAATCAYVWCGPADPSTLQLTIACVLVLYWSLGTAILLFLSVEQPPYQYVSVRDRVRALFARPQEAVRS